MSGQVSESALAAEAGRWYRDRWDPEMTTGEWFALMHDHRWAYPTWPEEFGGRGLPIALAKVVRAARREAGALGPPSGIGPSLLAPMLFRHGTPEQSERYLRGMARGEMTTCQMLSEPDAGSDLAATRTRADRDGDEWRVSGTKVWTSNANVVTFGMMLARTNWSAPKHRGLTFFLVPAQQGGITLHPIKQMNGQTEFNLVDFDSVRVDDADRLGDEGDGWSVARTFLAYEKNSFNPSAHEGGPFGAVALERTAGEVKERLDGQTGRQRGNRGIGRVLDDLVRGSNLAEDPLVRQERAVLHTRRAIMGYANLRLRAATAPGSEGSISKITVSDLMRGQRDLGLRVQGPHGMLLGDDSRSERFGEFALTTPSVSIAGGTDEIQRNHMAERVLGLPREPAADQDVPFSEVRFGSSTWLGER